MKWLRQKFCQHRFTYRVVAPDGSIWSWLCERCGKEVPYDSGY